MFKLKHRIFCCLNHQLKKNTQDDSDFEEPEPKKIKKVKQRKYVQNFFSSEVTSTLDRVALSDRTATFIIAATASSLGHETSSMPLSRSSIRRKRLVNRKACVETVKHSFNPDIPLIVHWDGKLLPDIKGKGKVDRLPILVTGKGVEKLLAVPKLKDGKSETISKAVVETLENWNLKNSVVGMCFDTTSSNTGRNGGACLLVERSLNKKLLYLACRHHIHELIVADVFKQLFGHSSGPNIQLFKRFQEHWEFIDRANFQTYESNEYLCDKMQSDLMQELRKDALEFGAKTLSENLQTRDDYRELIELCIIFLGGVPKRGIHFMAPGAFHHARWMAKCIYALKIYLFRSQFKLTCQEEKALAEMSLFISTVYMKSWIQSTEATSAPVNDLNLLKQLDLYKSINNEVSEIAVKKLKKHNWYLHEDLVCLSLFSDVVNSDVKMKMVNALSEKSECDVPLDNLHSLSVDSFVTERSASLLNALEIDTAFMDFPPTEWPDLLSYQQAQLIVRGVTVVNDCAERGVALITQYNSVITNNEEQKQYLLQVVSEHRRKYQSPAKSVLLGDC